MVWRFGTHCEDTPDLTAGWNNDTIQRKDWRPSEKLSDEWAQVNAQIAPLNTIRRKLLEAVLLWNK